MLSCVDLNLDYEFENHKLNFGKAMTTISTVRNILKKCVIFRNVMNFIYIYKIIKIILDNIIKKKFFLNREIDHNL